MSFPDFFEQAPVIRLRDPLAEFLGAADEGVIEYHYADAVRLAGHSCPTVAGAFLTGRAALAALYPDALAERGTIAVHMPASVSHGTIGVVAQVLALLTGAAGAGGFKGINGRFARNGLLSFAAAADAPGEAVHFERVDTGTAVAVTCSVDAVPTIANIRGPMVAVLQDRADARQHAAFANAWQERVRRILMDHADDPAVVQVTHMARADCAV